jgi:hypothetical protein
MKALRSMVGPRLWNESIATFATALICLLKAFSREVSANSVRTGGRGFLTD